MTNRTLDFSDGFTSASVPTEGAVPYLKKDGSVLMTANLNLDSHKIINVTDPTLAQDAATKNYVDTTFITTYKNTYANLVTWASTASDSSLAFSTDTKLLYYVATGILQEVAVMKTISGAVTSLQVSVGITAVRALSTGTTPNANRKRLMITPLTIAGAIYIGGSTVSITNGKPIIGPDTIFLDWDASDYFLVSDVAGNVVSIVEVI